MPPPGFLVMTLTVTHHLLPPMVAPYFHLIPVVHLKLLASGAHAYAGLEFEIPRDFLCLIKHVRQHRRKMITMIPLTIGGEICLLFPHGIAVVNFPGTSNAPYVCELPPIANCFCGRFNRK